MLNVFAQPARLRRCACQSPVISAAVLSATAFLPGTAWADCTASGTTAPITVTCTGDSPSYTNTAPSIAVTADSTAVIVGPLVIGSGTATAGTSLVLASGGNITGSTATATVQFGDYATITNNGTITSSNSGGAGIAVGINSTVTNNGTLTAVAGTPAVSFSSTNGNVYASTNGTFINGATAPAAVVGNVVFNYNSGSAVGTFINDFNTTTTATSTATYGLTGNVTGSGNMYIDNEGAWTGSLVQGQYDPVTVPATPSSSVTFINGASANFSGTINTNDTTILTNYATGLNAAGVGYAMLVGNGSVIGGAGSSSSLVTNNGVLTIGSTAAPALVVINGSFVQNGTYQQTAAAPGTTAAVSVTPVLNMAIVAYAPTANSASAVYYSEIDVIGGTAKLGGLLNVNVVPGFFPVGSKYDLIVATGGITGSFQTATGGNGVTVTNASGLSLPFITFGTGQIVSLSTGGQAYEFTVSRIGTGYADNPFFVSAAPTKNQMAVATGLQPLVNFAELPANYTTQEATLIGQIDQLTVPEAQALFDQMSPAGLVSYANALRDEANSLERQIQLRMGDQNSDHAEDGWWGSFDSQVDLAGDTANTSKQTLFGFNGGFDLSGPHHVFGVAGSVDFDSLHNEGKTLTGHNRDFAIAGYGGYDLGPIHLTGQVQYNFGHLSTTRTLTLGTVTDVATGKASEGLFKATATAGIMLNAGGYTLEPFGGIDFDHGHIHGFTETGDGAAALTVLPISANRTDLLAGVALTKSTGKFRPYLRATFRDAIGSNSDALVSAYFDGNTATQFTVTGVPAAKREGDINAGVNLVFEDAGSLFIGYQGTIRSGYNAQGINLGIRLEF